MKSATVAINLTVLTYDGNSWHFHGNVIAYETAAKLKMGIQGIFIAMS